MKKRELTFCIEKDGPIWARMCIAGPNFVDKVPLNGLGILKPWAASFIVKFLSIKLESRRCLDGL